MLLTITGKPPKIIDGSLQTLDEILLQAAEHIYKYTNPFTLASYFRVIDSNPEKKKCITLIKKYVLRNNTKQDDSWAYNLWGAILYRDQKKSKEAITKYQQAIKIDPKFPHSYSNLGLILQEQKKWEEAISKFKKAIELDPDHSAAYTNLGIVFYDQENGKKRY